MAGVTSKKKSRTVKDAVRISEDVIAEILKMLPVKSVLRFRCACKTWYSIVADCNKLHQKRACVLIASKTFSIIPIESLLLNGNNPIPSTLLSLPWQPEPEPGSSSKLLGSCNGLVCVYHRSSYRGWSGLILWNPSTRNYRKLPSTGQVPNGFYQGTYAGFGYDGSKDDYKFVWMACKDCHPPQRRIEFDVFSLKSKTWKSFDHCQPSDVILSSMDICTQQCTGVLFNGAIHWIIGYKNGSSDGICIFAFDLASEKYRLLESPPQECGYGSKVVVSLSGCLCLCIRYHMTEGSQIDLWMMKEYGVGSSWSKLVSFRTAHSPFRTRGIFTFYPIHFSKEEGSIVAMVRHITRKCEIVRLRIEKGVIVSSETLLNVSWDKVEYYDALHMEETLVSLN